MCWLYIYKWLWDYHILTCSVRAYVRGVLQSLQHWSFVGRYQSVHSHICDLPGDVEKAKWKLFFVEFLSEWVRALWGCLMSGKGQQELSGLSDFEAYLLEIYDAFLDFATTLTFLFVFSSFFPRRPHWQISLKLCMMITSVDHSCSYQCLP